MADDSAKETSTAKKATGPLLIGLDLGTNKTCIKAGRAGQSRELLSEIFPTLVGYAKEGIIAGILPGDAEVLFGDEALQHRLHLRLSQPLRDGVIADLQAAKDLAAHLRDLLEPGDDDELRAVIGVPARADDKAKEDVSIAFTGVLHKIILVPEPFLAALGYRDETKLRKADYVDPVSNSLFIDIGAGSTDLCLVQGTFPAGPDQVSIPLAGDAIDALLAAEIKKNYIDSDLSLMRVREIKEEFAYVGELEEPVVIERVIRGKVRELDVGQQIGIACNQLLGRIFDGVKQLIARADSESVPALLQNIVMTGGGSQIRNIGSELEKMLQEEGYDQPKVHTLGPDYKEYVAHGALKWAKTAHERQWLNLGAK